MARILHNKLRVPGSFRSLSVHPLIYMILPVELMADYIDQTTLQQRY